MFATTDLKRANLKRRAGFALPLAILALAMVTAAVAAASASTRAEIVANQATRAQDKAYQMAEAGLQLFTARRSDVGFCSNCVANPGTAVIDSEWTRVSLIGGYADVAAIRIRPYISDTIPALFFIKSRGVDTTAKMSGTGSMTTLYAERTVGQYGSFRTASIKPVAAYVSITGLTKNAGASISGVDQCFSAPSITGLALPTGEFSGSTANITGSGASPNIVYSSVDPLKASLGIDWNAIVNNNAIPAGYVNTWPGNTWAITRRTDANFTPSSDGRGILIALGDVTLSAGRDFDGIMLVGGRIITTTSSSAPSYGVFISGLNYLLPGAGNPTAGTGNNSTMTNNKTFAYHSCNVATAMALLDNYFVWSNTWLDNVAVW